MRSTLISLTVAAALAALLVGARVMLTPDSDAEPATVEERTKPQPEAPPAPAGASVAALEPAPKDMAAPAAAPLSRREAEARLEQIESQLYAMEAEVEGLDDLSEAEAEALFQRVEPLLEQLAEAELALEAAIEAEDDTP